MKEENKKYNVQQEVLYPVCLAAWKLCNENREKFAGLKRYYTEPFIADAIESVEDAERLPNLIQTRAWRKEARINLTNAARRVMDNWQVLKLYITEAFDRDLVNIKLEEAGTSIYKKAALHNWSAVRTLVNTANTFIKNNMEVLTANNNMPEDFQTQFEADGDKCIELATQFFSLSLDKEKTNSLKVAANNAIYASTIQMLKDGQQIFRYDEALRNQFIFKNLISIYSSKGSASLRGYVVNHFNLPVEGALIQSQDQQYSATTDAKGYYNIGRVAEGTYSFSVTAAGYAPVLQTITFVAGISNKADFALEKQMQMVA